MVLLGFGLGAVYWLLEAFLNIFYAPHGLNSFQLFSMPDPNPTWTRVATFCLFVIFGAHTQYILNERNDLAKRNERDAETRERFRRLLSPDLAEMVVTGELAVEKGGENRVATVMFADIRGFTKMSERTDPSELLTILNDYFELIVEIVFRHEGTVDKFIGDGIMVLWGAPVTHDDDPSRAVRTALEIQNSLTEFNAGRTVKGLRQVELGIGISTGNLVAGYIGSTNTMSYSVVGDIVNVAHGLCAAAEGGRILISEDTCEQIRDCFEIQKITPIQAKGKLERIAAFEVLAEKPSTPM